MALFLLIVRIAMLFIMMVSAGFIIYVVLRQKGDSDGVTAISGGSQSESFYGKNKAKDLDSKLKMWTIICGCVIAVCSIIFFVVL